MSHCDPSLLDLITDLAHQRVTQDTLDNLASITYRLDSIVKKPTRRSTTSMTNPTADEQVSASVDNLERIHAEIREVVAQLQAENESGVVQPSTLARLGAVIGQLDEQAPPLEATSASPPAEPPADNPDQPQPNP